MNAKEDLRVKTIEKLKGELRRLAYMVALRRGPEEYRHWGLAHLYGGQAAHEACAEIHAKTFREVVEKELSHLILQVGDEKTARDLLSLLHRSDAVPASLDAVTIRHYRRTVRALSLLLSAREGA